MLFRSISNLKQRKKEELEFLRTKSFLNKNIIISIEQIQRYFTNLLAPLEEPERRKHCFTHARYYFDDFELKKIPDEKLISEHLIIDNINFDTDLAEIKPESNVTLNKFSSELRKRKQILIRIDGYTDNVGDKNHNIQLSGNRAQSVANYLIYHGIDKNIISSKGFGSEHPIASNSSETGRAKNRRVEISIVKIK